jgi:hypothetical protein
MHDGPLLYQTAALRYSENGDVIWYMRGFPRGF